ncbi:prolyl 4-hydroxylase subunit alpha-2-like [Harmonia axyridis]|uniref:prolyl 4-hydroxylase subunit alpha-2-like n=1 Tax=Harmonia axyridis TaxID=115357 RepID=UPI001E279647|nr:prolyl 4-hydroxylase subunit alpha-2-like [Harmonia axyridis]
MKILLVLMEFEFLILFFSLHMESACEDMNTNETIKANNGSEMKNSSVDRNDCLRIFEKYGLDLNIQENSNFSGCSETFREEFYKILCRGDYERPVEIISKLRCYFQHYGHPFLTIAPFKVEEISKDPVILLYHDFVFEAEIEKIKYFAENKMNVSQTISKDGEAVVSPARKSKSCFLSNVESKTELKGLTRRIADSTTLSMDSSEYFQVVRYENGEYYRPHHDFFTHPKVIRRNKSNRIATFLMYLSDVQEGGYTVFPKLRLYVKPQKGAGIFWYNLFDNGHGDLRMLHGACDVTSGTKWISTKWIREEGQEFKRPCSRRPIGGV